MSNEYGFFAGKNHDRKYSADDFCAFFGDFFTDGILGKDTDSFAVSSGEDMKISIGSGTAYMKGRWYRKTSPQELLISYGDEYYPRYDAAVIRCDFEKRMIYACIREGVPSEVPEKPLPERSASAHELVLAYIYVEQGAVAVSQAQIEDTRSYDELCGWVTSAIEHIDTGGLFKQYDAQWELLKAGIGQDEPGIIAAWEKLNAVKSVDGVVPIDGDVPLDTDNVLSGAKYPKYTVQWGNYIDTSTNDVDIIFPQPFETAPAVFLTGNTSGGSTSHIDAVNVTSTGFTCHRTGYKDFNWIAFGDLIPANGKYTRYGNPIHVNLLGGKEFDEITIRGKNTLVLPTDINYTSNGVTIASNDNTSITITGALTDTTKGAFYDIVLTTAQTHQMFSGGTGYYTFSGKLGNSYFSLLGYNSAGNVFSLIGQSNSYVTYNLSDELYNDNTFYVTIRISVPGNKNVVNGIFNMQMEKERVNTTYTPSIVGTTVLVNINNYTYSVTPTTPYYTLTQKIMQRDGENVISTETDGVTFKVVGTYREV